MERRLVLFLVVTMAILMGYATLMKKLHPPKPRAQQPQQVAQAQPEQKDKEAGKAAEADAKAPAADGKEKPPVVKAPQLPPEPETPQKWLTLGSADPQDPYRMLVTLTNRGAALARIDLNSPRYCDVDNRSGFLGHIIMDCDVHDDGCVVHVVGMGTPAAEAGLQPNDILKAVNGKPVTSNAAFQAILARTRPNQRVSLTYVRDGKETTVDNVRLRRRPLELIQPEDEAMLSLLLTLQQFDDEKLAVAKDKDDAKTPADVEVGRELQGVDLRTANWQIVKATQDEVQFSRTLPDKGLRIYKTYRLAQVPTESLGNSNFPAYHLEFEIGIENLGTAVHKVAYRLDGPNGLPLEGKWYATKVCRSGGSGLRDFIVSFGAAPEMVGAATLTDDKKIPSPRAEYPGQVVKYVGTDAQYFSGVLIPERTDVNKVWFDEVAPIRVGEPDAKQPYWTNSSCRLVSSVSDAQPGEKQTWNFKFFAGPKKPDLLRNYGLETLVYYGWFEWVAVPLISVLHFFYGVFRNYGIAIILLTVVVRGCMFPLSRKQALGAQKMQELQPEIKRIQEKHKKDAQARTQAQQELFRKHNYNPLSGCLVAFIQLPVFIGLYRALMVDVELRDAPLLSNAIRWCSNLAAPDMLFNWSAFMPGFIVNGPGFLWLGPYFNILPILTIILFIAQQKMFMPPAADEQAAMQQKIMQYMMIFMGLLFYKVSSGLCIYFIASSLWGLTERRFLPKPKTPTNPDVVETRAQAKAKARQAAIAAQARKKK